MPIPFLIAGVAIAAAGWGVKKGVDAKNDFDDAGRMNSHARAIYNDATNELTSERDKVQKTIEQLGELKFHLYENQLIPFVQIFETIKNIDFEDANIKNELNNLNLTKEDLLSIKKTALDMKQTVGAGITSLGAGGLAGLAAYGSVGMFASASTGTAIAGLGGAAATNATLAWLGGGSLAAGGFGMAGGAVVLGGIVAAPVIAIAGAFLASKAEEAWHNAHSNVAQAEVAVEEIKKATVLTTDIGIRFFEVYFVLQKLQAIFAALVSALDQLTQVSTDYSSYAKHQKELVMMSFATAKVVKNLMEAQVLKDDGALADIRMPLLQAEMQAEKLADLAATQPTANPETQEEAYETSKRDPFAGLIKNSWGI